MIIFTLPDYLDGTPPGTNGEYEACCYVNGELTIKLNTQVRDEDCMIVGSPQTTDDLLITSLLSDTLRRAGCKQITALLPYLAYARQDQAQPGQSLGMSWVGNLLASSGVSNIITVDLHSTKAFSVCPIPIRTLSSAQLFADAIKIKDAIVVAPDSGAEDRAKDFAQAAGIKQIITIPKQRTAGGVKHQPEPQQHNLGPKAIVVDDVLDTGSTLVSCCQQLKARGVKQIVVAVTHGQFNGNKWQQLWNLGVEQIYVSNSLPLQKNVKYEPRIKVLPLGFSQIGL